MPADRTPRLRTLLLALAATGTGWAEAQTSPYYVGATAAANYDSNVFRLPQRTGDKILSVGVVAGIDQPIGRQRVYANGTVRNNHYQNLSLLNNTSYNASAGIDWATIEKLTGTLNTFVSSGLINYGGSNTTQTVTRNIEKSQQTQASVQYGMAGLLSLNAALVHRSIDYSDAAYANSELKQDVGSVGIQYRPSGAVTLGAGLRATRGDYGGTGGSFRRNDLDLTGSYVPSGLSTLNARLSWGRQTADAAASNRASSFSGATGYLSWMYQPTGKLQFNTWISRDTGAESSFFNAALNGQTTRLPEGDSSQKTTTLAGDASYALSGKINATAGVRTAHRNLTNGGLAGTDTINGMTLGASYLPTRYLTLACNFGFEQRSASSILSSDYIARTAGCSAQITLR